jgi:2Fe-2S ferredoxin
MSLKPSDRPKGPCVVSVVYRLEDPESLTGKGDGEVRVRGSTGMNLLELAMEHGINIEHACGGVCACSTCHIYVEEGARNLSESTEAEEDRVEEAPGLQRNSRLSCQCIIEREGPIVVRVPSWNRNAVKEVPH